MEDAENELLLSARRGEVEEVDRLFTLQEQGHVTFNINCKGENKANMGWSPLHLSSYFGHKEVVLQLLEHGADVNIVNDVGDTALHRAAYTGRVDVVMLLLKFNADVNIINAEGNKPSDIARTTEIRNLIQAAGNVSTRKVEIDYLKAVREGNAERVTSLLKGTSCPNINCVDSFGNTALHTAAYRGKKEVAVLLLQNGIDTTIKNSKGQTALDMALDTQMRQLLDVTPIKQIQKTVKRFEGPLLKKFKITGWKPTWLVLESGVMSFFRNRADATVGAKRKGFKYLDNAKVITKKDFAHIFTVHFNDNTSTTLAVETNDQALIQRQRWENQFEEHINYSTYYTESGLGIDDEDEDELEDIVPLGSMQDALEKSRAHQQLLEKQVSYITNVLTSLAEERSNSKTVTVLQARVHLAQIVETSQQMCSSLTHCLNLFSQQDDLRKVQLQQEVEKSRVLQEALHILAQEHHELEQSLGGGHRSPTIMFQADDSEENDEFYDCENNDNSAAYKHFAESIDNLATHHSLSNGNVLGDGTTSVSVQSCTNHSSPPSQDVTTMQSMWGARSRLPVPCFSRNDFSVWSILKQCIGKELSKITMPVIFNEPLSFLQRIVEYMEYATLLTKASQCDDPIKRLEYVTAFAVSATASNWERIGKPFNPLLGETYELVREDLGFRIVSEQVSHHPPVSAFHADCPDYTFHGAIHPKLKFWGKSVEITPKGIVTLELLKHGEVYTWQNVNCCVHNIIVGKLWIELYGGMEVVNHKTKHKAVLNFKPCGWFGKDLHKVEGVIYNSNKEKVRAIYGKWVEALYSYDHDVWENYLKTRNNKSPAGSPSLAAKVPDEPPGKGSTCDLQLPNQVCLWTCTARPADSEQFYNFTLFAMMLNELVDSRVPQLPPTDARIRPDIRKLEDGDIDGAALEKNRLEEKQRQARKERKKSKEEWKPRWFRLANNPYTGKEDWLFTNEYWNQTWEQSPDIF